ncbi:MAG: methionine ABC transporter ATP-binding protein, partial [Neisseria elongata]
MIILDNVSKHYQTRDKTRFAAVEPTSLEIQ